VGAVHLRTTFSLTNHITIGASAFIAWIFRRIELSTIRSYSIIV